LCLGDCTCPALVNCDPLSQYSLASLPLGYVQFTFPFGATYYTARIDIGPMSVTVSRNLPFPLIVSSYTIQGQPADIARVNQDSASFPRVLVSKSSLGLFRPQNTGGRALLVADHKIELSDPTTSDIVMTISASRVLSSHKHAKRIINASPQPSLNTKMPSLSHPTSSLHHATLPSASSSSSVSASSDSMDPRLSYFTQRNVERDADLDLTPFSVSTPAQPFAFAVDAEDPALSSSTSLDSAGVT